MAPPTTSNGVLTAPPKAVAGGNRKKQKRRAKQAAKQASPSSPAAAAVASGHPAETDYDEDALVYGSEDDDYDDVDGTYAATANGYPTPTTSAPSKKKKKKKGSTGGGGGAAAAALHQEMYNPELVGSSMPPPPHHPARSSRSGSMQKPHAPSSNIWNTSSQQERQNIKNFWLKLSEDERKSLLKIEKEAVLRKMKQQQKHSCSCTVCGRKRTAIEEELEVLYEGYYEELENYAHTDNPPLPTTDGMLPPPLSHQRPHPLATGPPMPPHHRASRIQEEFDDDDDLSEEEEEEYSDEDDDYSDDDMLEPEPPRGGIPDFFNFGANLTVKGILTPWHMHLLRLAEDRLKNGVPADNLLTVADDLLKNDGRKFIEMMEQLAERRMRRESAAEFQSQTNPQRQPSSHLPGAYPGDDGYHEDTLAAGEEFDDDEASYDSQEDFEDDLEEEDEMNHLTEEQRMQEGRRMFQIFAARMFEQRVLNAYREQVAAERQATLLEELENEDKLSAAREAKKQRDAEKKKAKKLQQKQSKAEEKARKDAEKAAEEERLKEAETKKQEEQRKRREEQRKKKDEERRKQEEDRVRKEAEKARRLQEEQVRREEAERKARELKAAEKAKKDEARKREREEREAREKEARERKTQEEKERKESEAKVRAGKDAEEREKISQQPAQLPNHQQQAPQITKRPSQPGMVAIPGVYPKQTPSGLSSPHPTIATPAVPKAPTPATRQRQQSQQGSHASSPKQGQGSVSSAPSKSSSPGNISQQQSQPPGIQRPHGLQKLPSGHQQNQGPHMPPHPMSATSPLPHTPLQPPPGMPGLPQHHPAGFGGMPPMGFQGFAHQGPMMPGLGHRGPMPGMHGFPQQHHSQPVGFANRGFGAPGMHAGANGMPAPPPGMGMHPHGRGMSTAGFGFDNLGAGAPPPGFGGPQMPMQHSATQSQATSPIGPPPPGNAPNDVTSRQPPAHSRQQSLEKERFESAANQPIARPTPIQRPSSVRPQDQLRKGPKNDVEDLSKHLGSSALLDDTDEPILSAQDGRRQSNMIPGARNSLPGPIGGGFGAPGSSFGSGSNWGAPTLPFGQPSLGSQQWGVPTSGLHSWNQNQAPFAPSNAFGPLAGPGVGSSMHRPAGTSMSRPWAIRLAVCQACRQLTTATRGHGDGFHPVDALLSQIESATNVPLDSPPTLRELEEICETVGDSQNGGGELSVRKNTTDEVVAVRWEDNTSTPDLGRGVGGGGLGEIGSPMPSKTSPAAGTFGAPGIGRPGGFQGLGAVGSGSFS
ncbi:hypothetical protein K431DRAFT_301992 [Polychaeton citri CBS 116435]|uniref:Stress response protein NST1 n=1 Tax=Polychaeton citri CBS 116435 TaxID=1314669 RepID=A0A9P4QC88_9PEZI|nr:hypothetical protein K431DRAFT_301992 [Polychaeton citri CBS 116435]